MKVLFIARSTLYTNRGGDTIQVTNTCKFLKRFGVDAEIKLSNEKIDYAPYDLVHYFNVTRPADILMHVRKSQKPYVVSTIFVEYSEFERKVRKGITGRLFKYLSPDFIEYVKVLARSLVNREKIMSRDYLLSGHKQSVKNVISQSILLLPNSHHEYERLKNHYGVEHDYKVIPNAIDTEIFKPDINESRDPVMVICVGRIEGLKNQLSLIRAMKNTPFRLYIVGEPATNQKDYYEQCKKLAGPDVQFIGSVPQQELVSYYSRAKVHVLPSWFETTGLSSLEAAAMGCNIVITDKGDTVEYFGDLAVYCDPGSVESIRKSVESAASMPANNELMNKVLWI